MMFFENLLLKDSTCPLLYKLVNTQTNNVVLQESAAILSMLNIAYLLEALEIAFKINNREN